MLAVARPDGDRPRIYYSTRSDLETCAEDPASGTIRTLVGWSSDGNHLAFTADSIDPQTGQSGIRLFDLDLARGEPRMVFLPAWNDAEPETTRAFWSSAGDLLAVSAVARGSDGSRLVLYDAATEHSRLLSLSVDTGDLRGWTHDGKILVIRNALGTEPPPILVDPDTALVTPAPDSVVQDVESRQVYRYAPVRLSAGAAGMISLRAGGSPDAVKDPAGKPHHEAVTLWLLVEPDHPIPPFTRSVDTSPNSSDWPALLRIDSYRTFAVWHDDTRTFGQPRDMVQKGGKLEGYQAALACVNRRTPGQTQVAYLISGDLYVSDITVRAPSVQELVAAGETLTCPEEQQLAMIDAKQIGLALMQYTQDYDLKYPMADGNFNEEITPYMKSSSVLRVGNHPFRYLLDGDDSSKIQEIATTQVGDFELPCGKVVVFADGHCEVLKTDATTERP